SVTILVAGSIGEGGLGEAAHRIVRQLGRSAARPGRGDGPPTRVELEAAQRPIEVGLRDDPAAAVTVDAPDLARLIGDGLDAVLAVVLEANQRAGLGTGADHVPSGVAERDRAPADGEADRVTLAIVFQGAYRLVRAFDTHLAAERIIMRSFAVPAL